MVKKIILQNIRCFQEKTIDFDDGVNLIIGPNGSGKTTILESIALFAFGSYQTARSDFLAVRSGQAVGRAEVMGLKEGAEVQAECAIMNDGKIFKVLTNKIPASQIVGFFKVVCFNPETIDLVAGPPHVRRRELDMVIAQKKKPYVKTLLEYRNVLKQRNQLLKLIARKISKTNELNFWDGEIINLSKVIQKERRKFLEEINGDIAKIHQELSGSESALSLKYLPSCDYDKLGEILVANLENDLQSGLTNFGPHRDDFGFQLKIVGRLSFADRGFSRPTTDDKRPTVSLREQASRGEQRTAAIAYKIESKKYLEGGDTPILIFDDVFSELDEAHREALAKMVTSGGGQTFISTTDEAVVPEELKEKAKILRLR